MTYFDFAGCGSWNEIAELSKEPRTISAVKGDLIAHRYDLLGPNRADLGGTPAYSMAFVGDTQKVTRYSANIDGNNSAGVNNLKIIYDWLIDNKETEKIEFVVGLGDITDTSVQAEWDIAVPQIDRLSEKYGTNFIAIHGNHDTRGTAYTTASKDHNYDPAVNVAYDDAMRGTAYEQGITAEQRMTNPVSGKKDASVCDVTGDGLMTFDDIINVVSFLNG